MMHYILEMIYIFVETPRDFIIAKLSIRKPGSSSVLIISLCNNKITWCFYKKKFIFFFAMQTYKELILALVIAVHVYVPGNTHTL